MQITSEDLEGKNITRFIDHTLLRPDATPAQILRLCDEAKSYGFASVCVNSIYVPLAVNRLQGSQVKVCTSIGFPLGATTTLIKVVEARDAIASGATELDMVINIGALKAGDYDLVRRDIEAVVRAAGSSVMVKVILETCLLTDEEKEKACLLAREAGAAFVKTSTGFALKGATVEDVRLMRRVVGPNMGVKAAGGIRDFNTAMKMIVAGATRLGTSSGVSIVEEAKSRGIFLDSSIGRESSIL